MLLKQHLSRQLFILIVSYSSWLLLYNSLLIPFTFLDEWVIHILVVTSCLILSILGLEVSTNQGVFFQSIAIDDYPGVVISHHCDALSVIAIFIIVLCVFSHQHRFLWRYILSGSVIIQFVNVIRIVCLSLIFRFHPEWLKFNHDYTFTILVYGVVVLIWWWRFRSLDKAQLS